MSVTTAAGRRRRRQWRFASATFDEGSWALLVDGAPAALEAKPLELLHELLLRAGEVVTKDELLEAVWPGVVVVEASLATAVSKLRKALGDEGARIIETVPRVGYRLAVQVAVESIAGPLGARFAFQPGDAVPGRPQWRLLRALGDSGAADVWRAEHEKTGESRIFKFADTPERLRSLKREAAIARLLMTSLGAEGPFAPLLEWNFQAAPYMLESVDGGASLLDWAAAHGGLAAIPLARRLGVAAAVARAVAAVHGVGILHKDLKPANILIEERGGDFRIRLADFGSGQVLDDDLLAAYAITVPESTDEPAPGGGRSGTALYRAPELVGDAVPTMRSDIYALGLVLFQLAVADFGRSLAPGWEEQLADPVLRTDIAEAAAGDPARRLASAALLADRLDRLEARRAEAAAAAERDAQLAALRRERERRDARRPWIRAAAVVAILGILATSSAAWIATRQRGEARRQQAIAEASYGFLADNLLARADPARSDGVQETLGEAAKRAAAQIDSRFADAPLVAARLHATLAKAFQERGDVPAAQAEYKAAEASYAAAGQADGEAATLVRLAHAQSEASSGQPEAVKDAQAIIAAARARLGTRADRGAIGYAFAKAEGTAHYFGDLKVSEAAFERAMALRQADPSLATPRDALRLKTIHALLLMRDGRAAEAEAEMRQVVDQATAMYGADHADTLNARQNLLNAIQLQHRDREVVTGYAQLLPLFEQRYGPNHRLTLALLSGMGDSLSRIGRYDEAAGYAEQVWRRGAESLGPKSHQALGGRLDLGVAQCRGGRTGPGLDNLRGGLADVEASFGADYPLAHVARYFVAECLILGGHPAEAAPILQASDRTKAAALVGDADWGANADMAAAEIALAAGDKDKARKLLSAATPAFAWADPESFEKKRIDRLSQQLAMR
ncbi:protein kinase domain-containing protein [Dyella sedimenti]|uniref:protein kinase domain-containing protein n=1 Tax=Dyella sedimenti TaxID=2919947 RepID=UPI001FAAE932|nr:winged helix-turn-helix domain-containing protein [Dyella sedimenti]